MNNFENAGNSNYCGGTYSMKSFTELISEAQATLDKIAAHDGFVSLLERGLWDDPTISLGDARQALEDLQKAHEANTNV